VKYAAEHPEILKITVPPEMVFKQAIDLATDGYVDLAV
jgi:hypothetical protein